MAILQQTVRHTAGSLIFQGRTWDQQPEGRVSPAVLLRGPRRVAGEPIARRVTDRQRLDEVGHTERALHR